MYPSTIDKYYQPSTVDEAARIYAECEGETMFIAGGMSLMQAIKSRFASPDCLIDLNQIEELKGISTNNDLISIGAMTRYRDIAASREMLLPYAALADAAAHVGDRQVRNRGTIGGTLCWNYIAACTPVATLAVGGKLEILRAADKSVTSVEIDDFLKGPMETDLEEGDLLLRVNLPVNKNPAASRYKKWGVVQDSLPVIGIGVFIELSSRNKCSKARFAVGGLSSGPLRAKAAEEALMNTDIADEQNIKQAISAASEEIYTADDPWISAAYRTHLIERLGTEVLTDTIKMAEGLL